MDSRFRPVETMELPKVVGLTCSISCLRIVRAIHCSEMESKRESAQP